MYYNECLLGGICLANHKRVTVGHSFRIDKEWLEILQEEADRQEISVNALTNKVLQNYCQHWRWLERFKVTLIKGPLLSSLIECCPNEKVIEIAKKSGSTGVKDVLRTMGVEPTYDNVTHYIENNQGKSANWFDYNNHNRGNTEIIHLRHSLGPKWSLFIATQTSTIFETILNKHVKVEIFENSATLEITK